MKEKCVFIFLLCISTIGTIFTQNHKLQKLQCSLEKAIQKSDLKAVNDALKRGARADRKVICVKKFKGKAIQDLADAMVEEAKKNGDAGKVRDLIARAIGQERAGNS